MLYELQVRVESDAVVDEPFSVKVHPYTVSVHCNKHKTVTALVISIEVENYQQYLLKLETNKETNSHVLTEPENPYFDEIISVLQTIESLGAFWFRIKRLYWDVPTISWKAQNEEEERVLTNTGANNFQIRQTYKHDPVKISASRLAEIIDKRNDCQHLKIPLSFYREGRNFFATQRYVYAFHSFYYYLEDLYADGKTKNTLVEKRFLSSQQMRDAVDKTLRSFKKDHVRHYKNLLTFLRTEQKTDNVDDVLKLIVSVSGNLHHFSQKSTKRQGHPFNQKEFETMAYLLMSICVWTYTELTTLQIRR